MYTILVASEHLARLSVGQIVPLVAPLRQSDHFYEKVLGQFRQALGFTLFPCFILIQQQHYFPLWPSVATRRSRWRSLKDDPIKVKTLGRPTRCNQCKTTSTGRCRG